MNRKGLAPIIIGIIALVLLVGIVGYFALKNTASPQRAQTQIPQPEPSSSVTIASSAAIDTSNRKTYTNQPYGFALRYPPEWRDLSGNSSSSGEILDIAYQPDKKICVEGVGCSYPGEIFVRGITKKSILMPYGTTPPPIFKNFVKEYIASGLDNQANIGTSTIIGGHEAMQIDAFNNITGPDKALVPNITELIDYAPDSVIWIEINYFPEDKDYVSKTFSQVLSTFILNPKQ